MKDEQIPRMWWTSLKRKHVSKTHLWNPNCLLLPLQGPREGLVGVVHARHSVDLRIQSSGGLRRRCRVNWKLWNRNRRRTRC